MQVERRIEKVKRDEATKLTCLRSSIPEANSDIHMADAMLGVSIGLKTRLKNACFARTYEQAEIGETILT